MRTDGPALMPIFRSQHQAELLSWLALHPRSEYSLSDLARRLRIAPSTLHREAERLEASGLLISRPLGRNRMLRFALDHPAAPSLSRLLEVTFGPRFVITEEFADLGAEAVLVFGSWAARHEGEAGAPPNDIDVLVVGSVRRADVYDASDRAQARLDIAVNPVIRSVERLRSGSDPLIEQILASPHLTVAGRMP